MDANNTAFSRESYLGIEKSAMQSSIFALGDTFQSAYEANFFNAYFQCLKIQRKYLNV